MKVDLVMWTWNSSRYLPVVLHRINSEIPACDVAQRIIVDDHSTDDTVEVALKHGWTVHMNKGEGLRAAIHTALGLVTARYFVSFEHDILLCRGWWRKIRGYMRDAKVAVAQGVRVATHPWIRKIDEYVINRNSMLQKKCVSLTLNLSIDNNIYRTSVMRKFRTVRRHLLDHMKCALILKRRGFKWLVDRTVVSDHIRESLTAYYRHYYVMHKRVTRKSWRTVRRMLLRFLWSPLRGLHLAYRKRCVGLVVVYSVSRFCILAGAVQSNVS